MLTRRNALILTTAALGSLAATGARAEATPPIFTRDGLAISGADPVAYFTEGKPVIGDPAHSSDWMGATWTFASADNKAAFDAEPERYAPQYGGYCAYAVSRNYTAKIEPEAWTIHEDKLYLNYSRSVRFLWNRAREENIASADANWPAVLG